MDKCLERHKLLKFIHKEIGNLNSLYLEKKLKF